MRISLWVRGLFLLLLFNSPSWGQQNPQNQNYVTKVASDSFREKYELKTYYLKFFHDQKGNLPFERIAEPVFQENFRRLNELGNASAEANHPFQAQEIYWAKINLQSTLTQDSEWILFLGYVSEAEIYTLYEDGTFDKKRAGFFVPNRALEPREGPEVKTSILLRSEQSATVYVRFTNELPYPPEPTFALQSYKSWQVTMNRIDLVQGIFHGLLWLMLLYNFFLYLTIRDKTYKYFASYTLFMSLYFFNEYEYLEHYFLSSSPHLSFYLGNLIYIALTFYILFNRSFLNISTEYPKWDKVLQIWLWVSVVFTISSVPLHVLAFDIYLPIRNGFHLFYLGSLIVFTLIILFIKDGLATLVVLGNVFILTGGLFIVLGNLGVIPFSLYYLLGGVAAQLFVFMMAMSYRYRRSLVERQETQEKLITQLQENERLQTQMNRRLEQKVIERTQEIEQAKEEIEAQNEALTNKSVELELAYNKITDSVRYAQRLQNAILGDEHEILSHFQDGFILFLPRDIVSGDFYWSYQIDHLRILIAADCTGHGIPGALMTVLGQSVLNDVVIEERFTSPDEILYELDKKVVMTIQKQTTSKEHPRDGMDMVVVTYDEISNTLKFAGAKNPLYYVRDHEIHTIKGSLFPIGVHRSKKRKKFELHEMQVQEGDIFYLTSDGFQDQFGSEDGRKYLKKRFREFLLQNSHLPMIDQKERLYEEFRAWKGKQAQTDDILIVGIKI